MIQERNVFEKSLWQDTIESKTAEAGASGPKQHKGWLIKQLSMGGKKGKIYILTLWKR